MQNAKTCMPRGHTFARLGTRHSGARHWHSSGCATPCCIPAPAGSIACCITRRWGAEAGPNSANIASNSAKVGATSCHMRTTSRTPWLGDGRHPLQWGAAPPVCGVDVRPPVSCSGPITSRATERLPSMGLAVCCNGMARRGAEFAVFGRGAPRPPPDALTRTPGAVSLLAMPLPMPSPVRNDQMYVPRPGRN